MNDSELPNEDLELRALLQPAMPPLPDAGFTQRVLRALPHATPRRVHPPLFVGAGTLIGIVVAATEIRLTPSATNALTELKLQLGATAERIDPTTLSCFVFVATAVGISLAVGRWARRCLP